MTDINTPQLVANAAAPFGTQIAVSATAAPGTLLYKSVVSSGQIDDIAIECVNIDPANDYVLVIGWGGELAKDLVYTKIPALVGIAAVVQSRKLRGGLSITAWCLNAAGTAPGTADKLNCLVDINRYPQANL